MTPHYFALHSRMGLVNPPIGSTELNLGVEEAPSAILSDEFLVKHPGAVTQYTFPQPTIANYFETIAVHSQEAATVIAEQLQPDETQVVIGGDHSVTFASLLALQKRVALSEVGYMQIDAHPDLNTIASSPSHNFHGMYLRAAVGTIGHPLIDSLLTPKLLPQNMWYFGNLSFDENPEERNFIAEKSITVTSVSELQTNQVPVLNSLTDFAQRHNHLHISIDIDGFDQSIAPATGIPCQKGFKLEPILNLLRTASNHSNNISYDLVEVNPRKLGAVKTIQVAHQILTTCM